MDAPVGLDGLAQALDRLAQLNGVAVLQEVAQEGVGGPGVQVGQGGGVGGVAGLGAPGPGHPQLVEQDGLELPGAGEVELVARGVVGPLGGVGDAGVELGLALGQHGLVHGDAVGLHLGQAAGHGHLQALVEVQDAALAHLLPERLLQRGQEGRAARRGQGGGRRGVLAQGLQVEGPLDLGGPLGLQVDPEPALRQGVDVVGALLGTAQVGPQGGVPHDAVQPQAPCAQGVPGALGVGDDQGGPGTAEQVE